MKISAQSSMLANKLKSKQEYLDLINDIESKDQAKIDKAAKGFEKMLVKVMLKNMTDSLENKSLFGKTPGSDIYNDMFLESISKKITASESLGLSQIIKEQLSNNPPKTKKNYINKLKKNYNLQSTKAKTKPKTLLEKRLHSYENIINEAAEKYDLKPAIIKAVIAQESYGNKNAVSHAGAKGLMQLMDGTAAGLGVKDSFNPKENIMAGSRYLRIQLNRFKDLKKALAAYNAGPGNVIKHGGIPPFKETKNYVRNVIKYISKF